MSITCTGTCTHLVRGSFHRISGIGETKTVIKQPYTNSRSANKERIFDAA